jgi:hypothetical protein
MDQTFNSAILYGFKYVWNKGKYDDTLEYLYENKDYILKELNNITEIFDILEILVKIQASILDFDKNKIYQLVNIFNSKLSNINEKDLCVIVSVLFYICAYVFVDYSVEKITFDAEHENALNILKSVSPKELKEPIDKWFYLINVLNILDVNDKAQILDQFETNKSGFFNSIDINCLNVDKLAKELL